MNLTGVLLEGSLKRDALGLLSFIGLSWILVPFQAYASIKALFEKKEGGWVRTPKSGRVTESLERFHLARLMPWELPKRKRGQQKAASGVGRLAAGGVVVLGAAGIITVGALSIRAAATSGGATENDLVVPALIGTAVPLLVLALGWLRLRRRMTAIVLAFTLGLGTNVMYLAQAVPANAVTDNSSVFTFRNTSSFGSRDMVQNYTPAAGTPATIPANWGSNWTSSLTSDTFTTGQTMNAGSAQADLYLENVPAPIQLRNVSWTIGKSATGNCTIPAAVVTNDIVICMFATTGGNLATWTPAVPTGFTTIRRTDSTGVALAWYWQKSACTGCASTINLTLDSTRRWVAVTLIYSGVDGTNPILVESGGVTPAGSYDTPSITTTASNAMIVATWAVGSAWSPWTPPADMTEEADVVGPTSGNGSFVTTETADAVQPVAGPTGVKTATTVSTAVLGAAHILALRPAGGTPSCTVTATLKKTTPVKLRASTTKTVNSGTSIVIDTPAGTQQNDFMWAVVAWAGSGAPTTPAGWTQYSTNGAGVITVQYTYYRFAGASEPANYTINFSAANTIAAWEGSYIGVDTTTPLDVQSGWNSSGTTHTTQPITTTVFGDMVVVGYALAANGTFTTPTGMTAEGNPIAGTSTFESLAVFDTVAGGAGLIAGKTSTSSVSGQDVNNIWSFKPIAANTVTLGSTTTVLGSIASPTLTSISFATSAATFATGDRLVFELSVPNDAANCGVRLSYDEATKASKLTVATIVPEGLLGLLLIAPVLPFAARWWKRRRP
jgi:hypothetical protein